MKTGQSLLFLFNTKDIIKLKKSIKVKMSNVYSFSEQVLDMLIGNTKPASQCLGKP